MHVQGCVVSAAAGFGGALLGKAHMHPTPVGLCSAAALGAQQQHIRRLLLCGEGRTQHGVCTLTLAADCCCRALR